MPNPQNNDCSFDCNICFSFPEEPITTPCGHIFCWKCYYMAAPSKDLIKCFVCRCNLYFHEVASLKITNYKERTNFLKIENYNIPPRPISLRNFEERQNTGIAGIKIRKNGKIEVKLVLTRNVISLLVCLFLMACICMYGIKNFLVES